jgi:hypothetical protein
MTESDFDEAGGEPVSGASMHERSRALGEARIRLAESIGSPEEWKDRWTAPGFDFPFSLAHWKHCMCYSVDDYAAEAGFLIDVLGIRATIFGPDNALLSGPDGAFCVQIAGVSDGGPSTPPETVGLMFYVDNIVDACAALEERGIAFEEPLAPMGGPESTFMSAEFKTPHGVPVSLWGTQA